MLTPLVLTGISISSFLGSYYFIRQRRLVKLYEGFEHVQDFDFDYIHQLQDLPLNKTIALCANIDTDLTTSKPSKYNSKKRVIFSQVKKILPHDKKITKQILQDENEFFDEYYNTVTNQKLPKIYLRNMRQDTIEIQWPKIDEIGLFNIKPLMEKIDPAKIPDAPEEGAFDKLNFLFPNKKKLVYGEIGIIPDEKYVYIGELIRRSVPHHKDTENFPSNLIFTPRIIAYDSKDFFMKYLDGQLVKTHKKTKTAFLTTGALGIVYLAQRLYARTNQEVSKIRQPKKEK